MTKRQLIRNANFFLLLCYFECIVYNVSFTAYRLPIEYKVKKRLLYISGILVCVTVIKNFSVDYPIFAKSKWANPFRMGQILEWVRTLLMVEHEIMINLKLACIPAILYLAEEPWIMV